MSENNHVFNIIGEDPFNVKILNETLWDIKESAFTNLYDAQKSLSDIIRFDFNMAEYASISNTECIYNIKSQFIPTDNRIIYRTSSFYKKDLSYSDITENPNIFYNSILLFINGEFYTNFYVRPNENYTSIVFKIYSGFPSTDKYVRPGFTHEEIRNFITTEAYMSVIFVKAHNESNFKTNRMTLNNYALVDRYLGLPIVNFININKIDNKNDESFLCMITDDDKRLYKYRLLTTNLNNGKLYFDADEIRDLTNNYSYLKNIYLLYNLDKINISAGTEYFELPIKDMPIPIENLLIFRKSGNKLLFDHETKLTLYYPNIYKINANHSDDLVIYVYYCDDTISVGSKYNNEISLYYRFANNIAEKYKDNTIPDIIKNYTPIQVTYDNNDLRVSTLDHLQYKINKLNSLIKQDGRFYSIYLNKLIGYVPSFFIDISEIEDLDSRYRTNNRAEIKNPGIQTDFTEPCYLFIFRHDSDNDKFSISIDEYQSNELYTFHDEKYTYVYIPVRMITPTSIINVDKYVDYTYTQEIKILSNEEYYKVNIPKNKKIQISDIFISTLSTRGEDIYMSKNDYKIYIYRNDAYEEITSNNFYDYDTIYIRFFDPIDLNKTVYVNINRVTFKQVVKGTNVFTVHRSINNDIKNILMFKNGRLVPSRASIYRFSDKVSGPHTFKASLNYEPEDEFTLIYNTNKYHLAYYQEKIDKRGLVNLTNKIDKPIDFKWYDIYLNGLKLDFTNVDILGPYIMLIKNVPTIKNLEIYQKNLDAIEENSFYETDDISSDIFEEIIDDITKDLDELDDTLPDLLDDLIMEVIDFLENYLFTHIKLINPDKRQITNDMKEKYRSIFDSQINLFMNPDRLIAIEKDTYLQPDYGTITVN